MNITTGSISNVLGVSGGVEPIFATSYTRKSESLEDEDTYYKVFTPIVEDYMEVNDIDSEDELPDYFVTAHELDWEQRIKLQGVLQEHIDASISSTINLDEDVSVGEVEDLYMYAYEEGLKGVTVFRNGCKRAGILTTDDDNEEEEKEEENNDLQEDNLLEPKPRPQTSEGITSKFETGCGKIYVTLNVDEDGNPVETFITSGSGGGCSLLYDGISRMTSLALRSGVNPSTVVEQLKSVDSCPSCTYNLGAGEPIDGGSCPGIIGKALEDVLEEGNITGDASQTIKNVAEQGDNSYVTECPECGEETYVMEEGCGNCKECGFTLCS